MDDSGKPQWVDGAAEYLESILNGEEVAFEWGGGASSIWLAPKVERLYVMETDQKWAETIKGETGENCGVWIRDPDSGDYLQKARDINRTSNPPNLWLIDGFQRIACFDLVRQMVEVGDIVVLDDALDYDDPFPWHPSAISNKWQDIKKFKEPHPYAGTPINFERYPQLRGNVNRSHHPRTKETWVCRV